MKRFLLFAVLLTGCLRPGNNEPPIYLPPKVGLDNTGIGDNQPRKTESYDDWKTRRNFAGDRDTSWRRYWDLQPSPDGLPRYIERPRD